MKNPPVRLLQDEKGLMAFFAICGLAILSALGIAASRIAMTEAQIVRNEQLATAEFYDAESGVADACIHYSSWLTDDFLLAAENTANATFDSICTNRDGEPAAEIEARCIENTGAGGTVTTIFDDQADDLPAMDHTAIPPEGSGYSISLFKIRRFGVTAFSTDGNTIVQAGVYKVFNKY